MDVLLHTFPISSPWLQTWQKTDVKDRASVSEHANPVQDVLARLGQLTQKPFLLESPQKEWRTPLLFQIAVSYATEGNNVVFICKQPLDKIPVCVHGMPHTDASVLKNVKFMYYRSSRELMSYCASVHLQSLHPDTIIVDDIEYFVGQLKEHGPEQALAKLCASLIDAVHFIQQKSGKYCPLIIGLDDKLKTSGSALWRLPIQMAAVRGPVAAEEHCQLSLTLDNRTVRCRYAVKDAGIFLSEVDIEDVGLSLGMPP